MLLIQLKLCVVLFLQQQLTNTCIKPSADLGEAQAQSQLLSKDPPLLNDQGAWLGFPAEIYTNTTLANCVIFQNFK